MSELLKTEFKITEPGEYRLRNGKIATIEIVIPEKYLLPGAYAVYGNYRDKDIIVNDSWLYDGKFFMGEYDNDHDIISKVEKAIKSNLGDLFQDAQSTQTKNNMGNLFTQTQNIPSEVFSADYIPFIAPAPYFIIELPKETITQYNEKDGLYTTEESALKTATKRAKNHPDKDYYVAKAFKLINSSHTVSEINLK